MFFIQLNEYKWIWERCENLIHFYVLPRFTSAFWSKWGTADSFQMYICSYRTLLWKHRHCEVFLNTQCSLSLKAFEMSLLMDKNWLWRLKMCFLQEVIYTQISTSCIFNFNPISKQSRWKKFNIYDPPLKKNYLYSMFCLCRDVPVSISDW